MSQNQTDPLDDVAAAAREAEQAGVRSTRAMDTAERQYRTEAEPDSGQVQAAVAVAEANLAVAFELRALRLVIANAVAPTVITTKAADA